MKISVSKLIFMMLVLMMLVLGTASSSLAAMVHYTDENGRIHYVNTAIMKVPEKYMDQVASQMEAEPEVSPEKSTEPEALRSQKAGDSTRVRFPWEQQNVSPENPLKMVDVLYDDKCKDCKRLFPRLKAMRVPFRSYNVESNPVGIRLFAEHPGMALPITIVNGQAVQGLDLDQITALYQRLVKP